MCLSLYSIKIQNKSNALNFTAADLEFAGQLQAQIFAAHAYRTNGTEF